MKKILTVSLFAMMAVSAANAEIASTNYVTNRTGELLGFAQTSGNLTTAVNDLNTRLGSVTTTAGNAATKAYVDGELAKKVNTATYNTKVAELEQAVAVMAANDAAIALAEFVGKSIDGFVEKMNQNAQSLGMKDTNYVSPIGTKDEAQYTTAQDTLILADALLNDCPALNTLWTTKMLTNGVLRHKNSNALLWRTDSIKGMHSSEHQLKSWDSVAYYSRDFIESQTRFSRELIAVSLGAQSAALNADDTMRLITWGSDNYKTLLLYSAGDVVDRIPVALTNHAKVRVGVKENIYATLARDAILQEGVNGFNAKIQRLDPLVAPISQGDIVGTLTVTFNGKEVAKTALIAQHDVQRSSFWRRTLQRIKAIFGME